MVAYNFPESLKLVLKHEGGFVNHPADPGGMTNLGVTRKVWEEFTGETATESDMRALRVVDVAPLYQSRYWKKCNCDNLPSGLDYAVFDYAVNSGVSRACRALQTLVGVVPDGVIGPATIAAVGAGNGLIERLCDSRLKFLQGLPTWRTFGKGWGRRVAEVQKKAIAMRDIPTSTGGSVQAAIQRAIAPRSGGR